jgi:hypothetical protein
MVKALDPVTFSVPRGLLSDIAQLANDLKNRMHELPERNADGKLGATEKSELESLVRMAGFRQIVTAALSSPKTP